jgi:hypothetical protein
MTYQPKGNEWKHKKNHKKDVPAPGIEPGSTVWKTVILRPLYDTGSE